MQVERLLERGRANRHLRETGMGGISDRGREQEWKPNTRNYKIKQQNNRTTDQKPKP